MPQRVAGPQTIQSLELGVSSPKHAGGKGIAYFGKCIEINSLKDLSMTIKAKK
jgi:hypothetical protein